MKKAKVMTKFMRNCICRGGWVVRVVLKRNQTFKKQHEENASFHDKKCPCFHGIRVLTDSHRVVGYLLISLLISPLTIFTADDEEEQIVPIPARPTKSPAKSMPLKERKKKVF